MVSDLGTKAEKAFKRATNWPLNSSVSGVFALDEPQRFADFVRDVRELFAPAFASTEFAVSETEIGDLGNHFIYNLTADAVRRTRENEELLAGIKAKAAKSQKWELSDDKKSFLELLRSHEKVVLRRVIDHEFNYSTTSSDNARQVSEWVMPVLDELRGQLRTLPKPWIYCLDLHRSHLGFIFGFTLFVPPGDVKNPLVKSMKDEIAALADSIKIDVVT